MTTTDGHHRVRRPLTGDELDAILATIDHAASTAELVQHTMSAVFTALLADSGTTLDDFDPDHRLNPADYAIPTTQWQAIVSAVTNRAQEWGTGVQLALDLVNMMPGSYDDPDVAAPAVPSIDRRPWVHDLHITREATDVIAACHAHLDTLGRYYGWQSPTYLTALTSWHRSLRLLFSMTMGAETHISRDGDRSLYVRTASGFVYAIIWHPTRRRCTTEGCAATIDDDGTAHPAHRDAVAAAHEHTPSYPLDAPHPGDWTAHS